MEETKTNEELWLLAGQSNMEGIGDLADAPQAHPLVRAFTLARRWVGAAEPLHLLAESPDAVHHGGQPFDAAGAAEARKRAVKGVGPGLWFARLRAEATGRPQGLICAAHGGTSMAQWSPTLSADPDRSLYASALASVRAVGRPLTGILWYQGCSDTNAEASAAFPEALEALVAAFRRDLGQADLPWLQVQIGKEIGRAQGGRWWNAVQQAQLDAEGRIPHLATVTAADLEHDDWIHVSARDHQRLGARLNHAARWLVDRDPAVQGPPRPVAAVWEASDPAGPAVRLKVDRVEGGWRGPFLPQSFALVDAEGRPRVAVCRVRAEGSDLVLRVISDEVGGLFLAHGPGCDPVVTLTDGRGLGLPCFSRLAVTGLPPVTSWFRRWTLSSSDAPGVAEEVNNQGWWYLVLSDRFAPGRVVTGRSWFDCPEAMEVEVRFGNDVPARLAVDGTWVVEEDESAALTSSNIDFERHRRVLTLGAGRHEVVFEARAKADGSGMGLNLRLARPAGGVLPEPWA